MNEKINKLNLGCGENIKDGYINLDFRQNDNIDVVHDLNNYPWPFENNSFDEIIAHNVIEHLDNFILSMEEIHRISRDNASIKISVPYWNSSFAYIDPTHKKGFHELSFSFFDSNSKYGKERYYYTTARFKVEAYSFFISPFAPYFLIPFFNTMEIKNKFLKKIIGILGYLFSNIILELRIELKRV